MRTNVFLWSDSARLLSSVIIWTNSLIREVDRGWDVKWRADFKKGG